MFVIIQENNNISSYDLNNNQIIYNGIRIYKKSEQYYIELKKGLYFNDYSKSKILEIKQYTIYRENVFYNTNIYVYDDKNGINDFNLYKNTNFLISNSNSSNIVCSDKYLKKYYLGIIDRKINTNFNILVNGTFYNGSLLSDGDIIDYLGIKIIYYTDFLYINNFNINIKLNKYDYNPVRIKYQCQTLPNNHYAPSDVFDLRIDDIKEYKPIEKPNLENFIKTLMPNIVMSVSMSMMAYLNYLNGNNNNNNNIIQYIIMPISMAITGILLPIIFILVSYYKYYINNKKNIDSYVDYLENYRNKLINDIDRYTSCLNERYFNIDTIQKMLFYVSKKNTEFLTLSIGKYSENREIKYKNTGIESIDSILFDIKKRCNNIDNIPLFLDFKEGKIATIVSRYNEKYYYFNRFLLETAYKHHYNDLYIGIYSKDIKIIENIYNLPHLYGFDKRFILNNELDLQELDQIILDRPIVIFSYDKYDYVFKNNNVYQLYFSIDSNDILKDSDFVIEYKKNEGIMYHNNTYEFTNILEDLNFNNYYKYLSRSKNINTSINDYTFKDVLSDNILENYTNNNHSLTALFSYNDNGLISLDLHDSKQGPHGLIGGSTGSGKSELIISLLLSLCIKYSPEYLNIVLIDYKGAGIMESLSYNGVVLPHIVASVSNLEENALERLIIALHNECKYRQLLFKRMSKLLNKSIMNIDDYNSNNNNYLENISHLVIVVDEFAELKSSNPEQIKELISISRIGRSEGIHLILATQKPAGVIDDEIWSNSRFKIALKVFEEKDSVDLIKNKDAAHLYKPGSFLMLVDNTITKGQNIYSKNDYYGNDSYKVSVLNNKLQIMNTYSQNHTSILSSTNYYCMKIIKTCNEEKYHIRKIEYMPPMPINRHSFNSNMLLLGQVDDYIRNNKKLLEYDIYDNLLIFSRRKNEINSIINILNENCIQNIIISNKSIISLYTSDCISYDDSDNLIYLFNKLLNNTDKHIVLVIEDIDCLLSYDPIYMDYLIKLIKRKDKIHISMICLTSNCEISYKLISLFKNKIMINISDINNLSAFYGSKGIYKGKSYCFIDEPICFVPINIEKLVINSPSVESYINRIPDKISPKINNNDYLIGYDINKRIEQYASSNVLVISYDAMLLEIYKRYYPNINVCLYDGSNHYEKYSEILWLGSGIFNQKIFYYYSKNDLTHNEGLYVHNNKNILIRIIDDE